MSRELESDMSRRSVLKAMGAGATASAAPAVAGSATATESVDPAAVDTSFVSDGASIQSCWTETRCENGIACSSGGGCLMLERTCCDGIQSVGTSGTTCGSWEESGCCTC